MSNESIIKEAMLSGLRQHIIDMVAKAQFNVGSTWHDAVFSGAVGSNDMVSVNMVLEPVSGPSTLATQFRLLNSNGDQLAGKTENIQFLPGVEEMMYRFVFGVTLAGQEANE